MKQKDIDIIKNFFNQKFVESVIIFGSQVTGHATEKSDVDIAVLYHPGHVPSVLRTLEAREDLSAQLRKNVDLVVLNRANPIVMHQVFKHSLRLINKNPFYLNKLFVRHTTDYADLKKVRRVIEEKMAKRRLYA